MPTPQPTPQQTPHPEPHDLTALAYDMIEGPQRDELLEHLAVCDACRATYDSYRDEQVIVRDAILRDARSGASEAAALERTLQAIAGSEPAPAGRVYRLRWWLLAGEAAAVALIGVGLFFFMKPDSPDGTLPAAVVPIAEQRRAPATVSTGSFLVPEEGQWRPASALPMDSWVMAGPEALSLALPDGSVADLDGNAVFRIVLDDFDGSLALTMLDGNGRLRAGQSLPATRIRAGEAGFQVLPGSAVQLVCESADESWRANPDVLLSWSRPSRVQGQVATGEVVLLPQGRNLRAVPMHQGEVVRWTPAGFEGGGENDVIRFMYAGSGEDMQAMVMIRERIDDMRTRLGELGEKQEMYRVFLKRLEGEWSTQWDAGPQQVEVRIATPMTRRSIEADGMKLELSSTSRQHWAKLTRDGKTTEYTAYTEEDLLKQLPEEARKLLK